MRSIALLLIASSLLAAGCTPTCSQSCRKLVRCDEVGNFAITEDECMEDCSNLENLYEEWEDQELIDLHAASRECIRDNDCAAIQDGVCYEEDLYAY